MLSDWFLCANWINILTVSTEGTYWVSAAGLVFFGQILAIAPKKVPPTPTFHYADGFGVAAARLPITT